MDEQVIRRVLGGGRDVYVVLMERVFRIMGNQYEAEEATQETLVRAI